MCMFCRSLFVLLYFFCLAIVLSVLLRFTDSDYLFGIFKLFLCYLIPIKCLKRHLFLDDCGCCLLQEWRLKLVFDVTIPVWHGFSYQLRIYTNLYYIFLVCVLFVRWNILLCCCQNRCCAWIQLSRMELSIVERQLLANQHSAFPGDVR
jgi:hypothetical protein